MAAKAKPTTVAEYIDAAPKESRAKLREMRALLKKAAPGATESINYGVAALSYQRVLFNYAGFKSHIGFYPTPAAIKAFEKELKKFSTAKGSIQFPLETPLPKALITKIAKFRVKELEEKNVKRK